MYRKHSTDAHYYWGVKYVRNISHSVKGLTKLWKKNIDGGREAQAREYGIE